VGEDTFEDEQTVGSSTDRLGINVGGDLRDIRPDEAGLYDVLKKVSPDSYLLCPAVASSILLSF
jgi:hypothetical protein